MIVAPSGKVIKQDDKEQEKASEGKLQMVNHRIIGTNTQEAEEDAVRVSLSFVCFLLP